MSSQATSCPVKIVKEDLVYKRYLRFYHRLGKFWLFDMGRLNTNSCPSTYEVTAKQFG
jgi:hypothetical protein